MAVSLSESHLIFNPVKLLIIPNVGLNINSKIMAATEVDIAMGRENSVSYKGEAGLFLAAIIARINDNPTVNGTVKIANLTEFKID